MKRKELLHLLAEGETVTIKDVDECITEEKEILINLVEDWLFEKIHNGHLSLDRGGIDDLLRDVKSFVLR